MSALDRQVGGDHYRKGTIQPIEYIHANRLGFIEGTVVKYITRWRDKGGVQDLEKIKHYIDLLIELESKADKASEPAPRTPVAPAPQTMEDIRKEFERQRVQQHPHPMEIKYGDPGYTTCNAADARPFVLTKNQYFGFDQAAWDTMLYLYNAEHAVPLRLPSLDTLAAALRENVRIYGMAGYSKPYCTRSEEADFRAVLTYWDNNSTTGSAASA